MLSWFGINSQGEDSSKNREVDKKANNEEPSSVKEQDAQQDSKNDGVSSSDVVGPSQKSETNSSARNAAGVAGAFGFLRNMATAAGKTAYKLKETVDEKLDKTIIGDLDRENQKFVREKHAKRTEDPVPPWFGYKEEEEMKTQIFALSADERHFLRDPPSGVEFHFELEAFMPVALIILKEDKQLQEMRFKLVPQKVKEERFWRNYFYRVSLIKQSSQLSTLANSEKTVAETSNEDITKSQPPSKAEENRLSPYVEVANEKTDGSGSAEQEAESHDWEKELHDELQDFEFVSEDQGENQETNPEWEKEIENMLGLDEEEESETKTE